MKIIGHRGAAGLAPENTLAGLRKALEYHVDEIEFDVRVTKDGVVVLHHDEDIVDAARNALPIRAHRYEELKKHESDLATLEEALRCIKAQAIAHIDVKAGEPIEPIVTILKKFIGKSYKVKDLRLASKDHKILLELHRALPAVPKVVIEPWSGVRARVRANQVNTKTVSMNQWCLWWGFIRGFKHSDWKLYAYTLNSPRRAKRWESYGLTGVITDYPDRFRK